MAQRKVYVVGVGMTKFEKPGKRQDDYPDMAKEAIQKALSDANISYDKVQQATVGYVYGDSTCGQRCVYEVGMSGIPIYNVNNNCSTGASAIFLGKQLIEAGNDCVLAMGFEKMERGSLSSKFSDRTNPLDKHVERMIDLSGIDASPVAAQLFGNAGIDHMNKYGTTQEHFAKIAYKNHKHSVNNPYSQFRDEYTLQQILDSPKVFGPLTKLQCCPTSDGAAAVILASEDFVLKHNLKSKAVEIIGMEMATDTISSLTNDNIRLVGFDMTAMAANRLYEKTGIRPEQVQVVELHDCFSANELITYEALGLCPVGGAGKFIDSGDNTYGGRCVVNPSGGLISKGHPLGATGFAQCSELVWQLRGEADKRQVPGANIALQHNLGLGGAVVVALYKRGFSSTTPSKVAAADSPKGFQFNVYTDLLQQAMEEDTDNLIENVRGIYGIKVTNGPNDCEGYWEVDARTGKGTIKFNGTNKPDLVITISDLDANDLMTGKLNPQAAFLRGKAKVKGNMGKALKLLELYKSASHRIEELRAKL